MFVRRHLGSTADGGRRSRRRFLARAGAAGLAWTILQPQRVRGYAANARVRLGLIGCGNRGVWIASLFREHGGYELAAAADYFQDRVDAAGERLGVPPRRRFTGLGGYRRLLQLDVDAVAIESPPYFHPEQAAAAVEAGKHVYLAKPIAVDVAGCKTVQAAGEAASRRGQCFLVDFQTRANPYYREAIRRVHEGAIGRLAFGEASYHANNPWRRQIEAARRMNERPELRLRAWGLDRVLSGDIITEQNIHALDVASWIMNQPPECAFGAGGQKVRDFGDCWDTFSLVFRYPDGVGITFSSRQFSGFGTQPEGIRNRMFGSAGVLETQYGGQVTIRGEHPYPGGDTGPIYKQGAVTNIAAFYDAIQRGDAENFTVGPSVRSNLVTILGRTAAYAGRVVTWDELLQSDERWEFDTSGLTV